MAAAQSFGCRKLHCLFKCKLCNWSFPGGRFGIWMNVDPDNKVHGANMGPIWGRQVPGGSHVGPMNFAFWGMFLSSEIEVLVHWHSGMAIVFKYISCSWLGLQWVWILWVDPIPTLQWRHYERDGASNHQVTGEFPAQRASNAENDSIWRRHHEHVDQWPTLINVVMYASSGYVGPCCNGNHPYQQLSFRNMTAISILANVTLKCNRLYFGQRWNITVTS